MEATQPASTAHDCIPSQAPPSKVSHTMCSVRSLGLALLAAASCASAGSLVKRAAAYYDPALNGGSMLTNAGDGYGEPLNVRTVVQTCFPDS